MAVGVVDVLPGTFCSNYLFYNPEYRSLELGKVFALFEIHWQRLVRHGCVCGVALAACCDVGGWWLCMTGHEAIPTAQVV